MYYVANDLQFYILVMMPAIRIYHSPGKRWLVLSLLTFLILLSIVYLFSSTLHYDFPAIVNINTLEMFYVIYRRPFGPVGYYALGIMLSIFYFEYTQVNRNAELKKRLSYRFMKYVVSSKKSQLIT